jgi:hypothetical protein
MVHKHSGPETFFLMTGEQCVELPDGAVRVRAGETPISAPAETPMKLTIIGPAKRDALFLIVHNSSQPWNTFVDWQPKGLCHASDASLRGPTAVTPESTKEVGTQCSNDTYKGDYGFTASGTAANSGAFAMIGRFTADGLGNITGRQTRNVNGQIVHETYTETYTVNPDCTGSSQKKIPTRIDIQFGFDFVVLNHGNTIEAVQTYPGSVVTLHAERSD